MAIDYGSKIVEEARRIASGNPHYSQGERGPRTGPNSYDCSGFVYVVYKNVMGEQWCKDNNWTLNTAAGYLQYCEKKGKVLTDKSTKNLKPGALRFFATNTSRYKNIGHIAIAVGDGTTKVIDASSSKDRVLERTYGENGTSYVFAADLLSDETGIYSSGGYFEDDNDTNSEYSNLTGENSPSYGYDSINTTYETIEKLDVQPFHAVVDLWVGGLHFPSIPPQYLQSLEFTNIGTGNSTGGTCVITLFDRYSDEVEEAILRYGINVAVRFGHASGRQSKIFNGTVTNYNITNHSSGNILTINLQLNGISDNLNLITLGGGTSPSDAVRSICNANNWSIGRIDEAVQIVDNNKEPVEFNLVNDNPIDYIINKIAPRATRVKDGKAGYQFYFDTSVTPATANFHPIDIRPESLRTYVYQKGKNSPLLYFSVTDSLIATGVLVNGEKRQATKLIANGVNSITKEEYTYSLDVNSVYKDLAGTYTSIDPDKAEVLVDTKGMSEEEAKVSVQYRLTTSNMSAVKATASLIGDPTLEIGQQIRIIILNFDNTMHHTSGIYQIEGVSHNISSGTMTTTLSLFRNGDSLGTVELKSYSGLYK